MSFWNRFKDDTELFAIEAWMRRQGITGKTEAEREQIAMAILAKMRLQQAKRQQEKFFEHKAIPRGIFRDD